MSRLLLVGWDAADWKVIEPLLARGEMPHLARVLAEGVRGNLATIYPPLSPMVWTSIATGKRPYKHGIHGFTEPLQDGMGVRPVSNLGRTTKAVWNILNQNGKRSIVVGWWPSHPAEPIRGAMVSNHFPLSTSQDPGAAMAPGTVWPQSWAARLAELRIHGMEITGDILRMFVPDLGEVDQEKDKSLHDLAGIIAETMSVHAAVTDLIENEPWDFAAIYYAGIDHFSHRFMRYHAGKGPARGGTSPDVFRDIVVNAYRYHDVMLGRLLALAGPECAVMVLSDHGFQSDRLLPDYIPPEAAGPAVEHRHFGIFALRGPGVLRGQRVYGASVLDIAPTVLHLFGLPTAGDMDGKVLINAFEDRRMPQAIPSWDEVPGEDGRHAPEQQYDGVAAAESLKQLVALGYIAPLDQDASKAVNGCVTENRYNLARAWMDGGRPDMAAGILRELLAKDPEQGRYYEHLFQCLLVQDALADCAQLLESFDRACAGFVPRAAEELKRRLAAAGEESLAQRPEAEARKESYERRELAQKANGFATERMIMRCRLAVRRADKPDEKEAARALLQELASKSKLRGPLALFLAESFAALGDGERALEFVRRARRTDPENWQAITLEARIHHAALRHAEAVNCAIESLSLVYFQPTLHYVLGLSLRHLGDEERAADEFRIALSQAPGLAVAHDELSKILRQNREIGQASLHMVRAAALRKQAKKRRADRATRKKELERIPPSGLPAFDRGAASPPADRSRVVTVVSGLPRSGTSMMMQMLAAAGLAPYTDGQRQADEDNPRGYFEHQQATRLHQDHSWIPEARGKAVKIVAQLLPHLPAGEEYRVIFLHRNLEEVVASQRAMLERLGQAGAKLDDRELMRAYTQQLVRLQAWLNKRPEIQVLSVNYGAAIHDPAGTASKLAGFLGEPFDIAAAQAAVDASLRRQRVPDPPEPA